MPTVLSKEELRARFNGQVKAHTYDAATRLYKALRIHAHGEVPIFLIKKSRPNESENVRDYREDIYEPETVNPISRVISLFEKIRRSPDWMLRFDSEVPPAVVEEEAPEVYLTEKYPEYQDIERWVFEEVLPVIALDANAVVAVLPTDWNVPITEYQKPIGRVFNSTHVVDFLAENYAVLKSDEYSSLLTPDEQRLRYMANTQVMRHDESDGLTPEPFTIGQVYYVIDTMTYQKWEVRSDGLFQLTNLLSHGLGQLPAFMVPGKFMKRVGANILQRSVLAPMVPHLNKAARESNDLDAGVVMHLFLEKWRINSIPCNDCNGTGRNLDDVTKTCVKCSGTGMSVGKSPFNEHVIKPNVLEMAQMPIPPLGYVAKDPKIIELQDKRIEQHIYRALASINMEHLAETMLNQSGVAKQYDRDEVNSVVYTMAEYLCYVLNRTVYFICEMRYKTVVPDEAVRKEMLPKVPVPEKYDVLNSSFLLQEYQAGKTAGLNGILLSEMQKELAQKKFYANPKVADFVQTVMELDPFPDKTVEEKSLMVQAGIATKEDVLLSTYITDFVKRANEEDKGFNEKPLLEKREKLLEYAKEKMDSLNTAAQMQQDLFGDGIEGESGKPGSGKPGEEEDEDEDGEDDASKPNGAPAKKDPNQFPPKK